MIHCRYVHRKYQVRISLLGRQCLILDSKIKLCKNVLLCWKSLSKNICNNI